MKMDDAKIAEQERRLQAETLPVHSALLVLLSALKASKLAALGATSMLAVQVAQEVGLSREEFNTMVDLIWKPVAIERSDSEVLQ